MVPQSELASFDCRKAKPADRGDGHRDARNRPPRCARHDRTPSWCRVQPRVNSLRYDRLSLRVHEPSTCVHASASVARSTMVMDGGSGGGRLMPRLDGTFRRSAITLRSKYKMRSG